MLVSYSQSQSPISSHSKLPPPLRRGRLTRDCDGLVCVEYIRHEELSYVKFRGPVFGIRDRLLPTRLYPVPVCLSIEGQNRRSVLTTDVGPINVSIGITLA